MSKSSLISVIVPVYNSALYLDRCIESILNQSYHNIELILVNDGSDDDSLLICKKHAKKDSRVVIIDKDNGGVSAARNDGIKMAKGDYIAFVDADDFIEVDMYEKMYRIYQEQDVDLVVCSSTASVNSTYKDSFLMDKDRYGISLFINNSFGGYLWNKLYKANIIKEKKLLMDESVHVCEDLLFNFSYLKHISNIYYLNCGLYNYMIYPNSASNRFKVNDRNITALDAYLKVGNLINVSNLKLYDIYIYNLLITALRLRMRIKISRARYTDVDRKITLIVDKYKRSIFFSKNLNIKQKIKLFMHIYCLPLIMWYNRLKLK